MMRENEGVSLPLHSNLRSDAACLRLCCGNYECPLVCSIYVCIVSRAITLQLDTYADKMQANTLTRHFERVKSSAIVCRKRDNSGETFVRTYVIMLIHLYIFINY